jgi:hypothetical protein
MKNTEHPQERQWKRIACYFPLLAIGLEFLWCVALFLGLIFMVGDTPYTSTEAKDRLFDLIASFPIVAGLLVGIVALTQRWPDRKLEWICLIVGSFGCALLAVGFARGLVH